MADTYTLIEKITVGAAGASSVTFTSIPQTYTDLKIVYSARAASGTTNDVYIKLNASTTSYSRRVLYGNGTIAQSANDSGNWYLAVMGAANNTSSTFSSGEIYIPNYTSSNNKSASADGVNENNATLSYQFMVAGLWSNTAAITSIEVVPDGVNFAQYSTFYLYGIAKDGVNPSLPSAPYATGGDSILFDGTYWIHTFTSSGTFTPKKALTCDYLVVAGGGASTQGAGGSGGGGAGGLRSTVTATGGGGSLESALSLAANTGYTVTVGAGGSGGSGVGTNGSNSVFSTITSTGGGRSGGTNPNQNGASGGSGGGGGEQIGVYGTGGAGTANQGYAGGNAGSTPYRLGGGGGAGAAGVNGGASSGNGGAGVAVSISGSSVTYAGGGGGAAASSPGTGGAGGGGNGGNAGIGTAGTANTGGGAGGSYIALGVNGGSGIVIVRYAA